MPRPSEELHLNQSTILQPPNISAAPTHNPNTADRHSIASTRNPSAIDRHSISRPCIQDRSLYNPSASPRPANATPCNANAEPHIQISSIDNAFAIDWPQYPTDLN